MNINETKINKFTNQLVFYTIQFKCISSIYQNIIIKMNPNQEHKKRKEAHKAQQSASNSDDDEEDEDDDQISDFIVDDEDESDGYERPYRRGYSDDEQNEKKKKKQKKKDKKKKKEKKKRQHEQSYDEDDLDLIDNDQKLTRLKKKKQPRRQSDQDEDPDRYDMVDDDVAEGEESLSGDDVGYRMDQDSNSFEEIQEVIHREQEIFDPADLKKLAIDESDRDLAELDLPQRYISQIKMYSKNLKMSPTQVLQKIESEAKDPEAKWIYHKIRSLGLLETYEEQESKLRIQKVLECIHNEHLDIMYIFYYRKKIYADYLNLEVLWKIQELDEEWHIFREKQKKILDFLEIFLPSNYDVPREIVEFANVCPDLRSLKYVQDFTVFAQFRWLSKVKQQKKEYEKDQKKEKVNAKAVAKKVAKYSFISQIAETGTAKQLQASNIFLSPQNLVYNLKTKSQDKKPKTPSIQPKYEINRMLKIGNLNYQEAQEVKEDPLKAVDGFKTVVNYLCYELYAYPQFRRILKEKYFKKLLICTQPTKKGMQDIDLYSIYFPVKRIKDKHVSTLKRQIWVLAQNAKKLGLITIELRFEWQLSKSSSLTVDQKKKERDRDSVFEELSRYYLQYQSSKNVSQTQGLWNVLRKSVLVGVIYDTFLLTFHSQVKEELSLQGQRQIIQACCQKLRQQLNKGPSFKEGKPKKILSMVLEDTKLGIAFVDQSGKPQFTFHIVVTNDEELRRFVGDQNLSTYIRQYKPDMILIAANCKRAQTLRKELRDPKLFPQSIFCAFGQYEVPRLVAKKQIINGIIQQEAVLQAISMARLKTNPMSQIITLWSQHFAQNGVLSMNLHQYQNFVNQRKLKNSLQKVIIEVVNMVGLDINQVSKNQHLQKQLQFISGLGPKKSFLILQKLKDEHLQVLSRRRIQQLLNCKIVSRNCCPFLKIETSYHKMLFQKSENKDKKGQPIKQFEEINLLDMTRVPPEWYSVINAKIKEIIKTPSTLTELKQKKQFAKLSEENIFLFEIFKNPEKIRGIEWKSRENGLFDQQIVKSQIMSRFRNPRDPERVMQNRQIFFNLLRQTPETLKRYMIMQVRVLSMKKSYLNVIIPENGLFGYIKLQGKTPEEVEKYQKIYEKGTTIKAVIIGFPFDEKSFRDQQPSQEQQLLKIEMALDFPHKDNDRHDGSRHDCMATCFPAIVKEIHPAIDLEKDRFDLRKEDRPIIQVKQEKYIPKSIKADFRRISHPKFKNISAVPAIEMMKDSQIGDFIIRPSSQGPEYLTVTWNFFKGVIVHIKVRCEQKGMNSINMTYRIEDKDNRSYNSLQEIIQKCIKPMNVLVQDITSNKKFLNVSLQQIESQVKRQTQNDGNHIYYYFGISQDFPQYILLIYMYKDKKPVRELIKIKSSGLYFHEQQFSNTRDLITWFKEHLKEKEYQKYVKNATQMMQRMK